MIFQQILLQIFHKFSEERTVSAPYHLLRGKRSGQTIQDVGIYHLHKYFGILPKLARHKYEATLSTLIENGWLVLLEDGYYQLTHPGINQLNKITPLPFDGWHYRGNEHLYFARLSLVVQTLSHQAASQMSFVPIQKDNAVQHWVRRFLKGNLYQDGRLGHKLLEEIIKSLEEIKVETIAKDILMLRLSGFQTAGLTWQQIGLQKERSEMDIQLLYIAALHSWLNEIIHQPTDYPLLAQLTQNVRVTIPLSGSASQTAELYKKGYSIEQIGQMRRLKLSTIEDHIVELAMNDPAFHMERFLSNEDVHKVADAIESCHTRKLKVLRDVLPHLTYFQIRLVLARGDRVES